MILPLTTRRVVPGAMPWVEDDRRHRRAALSRRVVGLLLPTVLSVLGCSSSSGSTNSTCASLSPCGGNLVGVWTISAVCVSGTASIASCPAATIAVSSQTTGTMTFRADGSYVSNVSATIQEDISEPLSCLGSSDCSALVLSLQSQSNIVSATCTLQTSICQCHVAFRPQNDIASAGTYATAGNSVTKSDASGTKQTMAYCVQGNSLTMQGANGDGTTTTISAAK